ncbi:MAG: tripartite tricarboxylate transporter substrate binding protein [Pseudomonadota bacterium]
MTSFTSFARAAFAAIGVVACMGAFAQDYPSKPVKFVVSFPAGSGSDIYTRLIAEDFRADMNQSFVVENRPGASAQIGSAYVAKSAPDGYTLLMTSNTAHAANPSLFKSLPYDPVADFTGIGRVLYMPYVLLVAKNSPINSVKDLIDRARAKPSSLSYGYGNSSSQVLSAAFSRQAQITSVAVPYKSAPATVTDLIGGHVDYVFSDVSSVLSHLQAGTVRAIGFSLLQRSPQLPNVPAIAETPGMEGFELTSWVGLLAPAGTPRPIVDKLNAQLRKTLAKPQVRDKLIALGAEVVPSSPAEMDEFVKQQLVSWGSKIRAAGIQPE